jgi:hypothetical protein
MKHRFIIIAVLLFGAASCGEPSGALVFETIVAEDVIMYPSGEEYDRFLDYKLRFSYPSQYGDYALLEKLQKQFIRYTLDEEFCSLSPQEAVDALITGWKKAYQKETEDDSYSVTGWKIECRNSILFMNESLLQLKAEHGFYPYAAHIFENTNYALFNLQTGEAYSLSDLFKPYITDNISQLIINELVLVHKEWNEEEQSEIRALQTKEKLWSPNTTFALTDEGFLFSYQAYEIDLDEYLFNALSCTLSYASVLPFLREDTPVYAFAKKMIP